MIRGHYKTVNSLAEELKLLVSETGYATSMMYYSEKKGSFVIIPRQGVEFHGRTLRSILQQAIDYIRNKRIPNPNYKDDKRKSKYTLDRTPR